KSIRSGTSTFNKYEPCVDYLVDGFISIFQPPQQKACHFLSDELTRWPDCRQRGITEATELQIAKADDGELPRNINPPTLALLIQDQCHPEIPGLIIDAFLSLPTANLAKPPQPI